jgi:transcription elongation factor GreA
VEQKVILTQAGYDKLFQELTYLKSKKRKEVSELLATARAHGDLRENAEYDAAKEAKKHLETQIAKLEMKLANACIIDPSELPQDKAYLGAKVEVKNLDSQEVFQYILVPPDETNFAEGKIGTTSPIGKALLGKGPKDLVEVKVPAGTVRLEILRLIRE